MVYCRICEKSARKQSTLKKHLQRYTLSYHIYRPVLLDNVVLNFCVDADVNHTLHQFDDLMILVMRCNLLHAWWILCGSISHTHTGTDNQCESTQSFISGDKVACAKAWGAWHHQWCIRARYYPSLLITYPIWRLDNPSKKTSILLKTFYYVISYSNTYN